MQTLTLLFKQRFSITILLTFFMISGIAASNSSTTGQHTASHQSAVQIIDQMEALYRGTASKADITMIVETPQYRRTLTMTSSSIGTENTLIRIVSPKKDRGIATLKLNEEMWNYLPKINKTIKIPPSMMMGSWMGSDFTNDDLVKETTLTEQYDLTLEESTDAYNIILVPKTQTVTVWGKIDYVVNKQLMVPERKNFYDDKGVVVRKLLFIEPKVFSGRLIPSKLEMIPLNKTGHKTTVVYNVLEFDPPDVNQDSFTLRHLRSRF